MAQKRGVMAASTGSELLVCVFRLSEHWANMKVRSVTTDSDLTRCEPCLQVTVSTLYSILGYSDISLSYLCLSLCVEESRCVYFCVLLGLWL